MNFQVCIFKYAERTEKYNHLRKLANSSQYDLQE